MPKKKEAARGRGDRYGLYSYCTVLLHVNKLELEQRKARAEGQTAQPLTSVGRRCGRYATVGRLGIRLRFGFFQRVDEQRLKSLLFQIY